MTIPILNQQLENELKRLGFENFKETMTRSILQGNLMYMGVKEKLPKPYGNGLDMMAFSFVAMMPDNGKPSVEYIHTELMRKSTETGMGRISELIYWKMDGLPIKAEMIRNILRLEMQSVVDILKIRQQVDRLPRFTEDLKDMQGKRIRPKR
jgi:hypothetical protein